MQKFEPGVILLYTSRNPSNPEDWCQDFMGPDQFPAAKSPSENYYYLFNLRFWHHLEVRILGTKILISWPIFYVDLKSIKAFDPVIKNLSIISFTVFAERRVKVDALVSVKW